jgi:hypothetical protein
MNDLLSSLLLLWSDVRTRLTSFIRIVRIGLVFAWVQYEHHLSLYSTRTESTCFYLISTFSSTTMSVHWKERVADKRRRQQEAIPSDWRISAPGSDVLNVTAVPDTCGLLSERELEITNTTDVPVLLEKLASGTWSSVDVTTAFYKRAIVAQQLV